MLLNLLSKVSGDAKEKVKEDGAPEGEKKEKIGALLTEGMAYHVKNLGEMIEKDKKELESLLKEQKKHITSDDLHDGFDSKVCGSCVMRGNGMLMSVSISLLSRKSKAKQRNRRRRRRLKLRRRLRFLILRLLRLHLRRRKRTMQLAKQKKFLNLRLPLKSFQESLSGRMSNHFSLFKSIGM